MYQLLWKFLLILQVILSFQIFTHAGKLVDYPFVRLLVSHLLLSNAVLYSSYPLFLPLSGKGALAHHDVFTMYILNMVDSSLELNLS